jgi:glycosyltransferase involved in cell wall biosynthesis
MYHADLLGGLAARMAGINAVIWSIRHTNLSARHNKKSTLLVARACALLSGIIPVRIICAAQASMQSHIQLGYAKDKIDVIFNGLDVERFRPNNEARQTIRSQLGLEEDTPVVGLIARFDIQKGHDTFIKTAAIIHKCLPSVRFVLVGRDINSKNERLMNWIDRCGLSRSFHLLGQRSDVHRVLAAFDVMMLSSVGEGFPNVVAEAMACGVPCVVTNVGDAAHIVGDTGYVCAVNDVHGLADATIAILDLPRSERERLGARARHRIAREFSIEAAVKDYCTAYEQVKTAPAYSQ